MKNIIAIFFLLPLFVACNSSDTEDTLPKDLAAKKELLHQKKQQLKSLQTEMDSLIAQIERLDGSSIDNRLYLVTTQKVQKQDFERFVDMQASVQSSDAVFASSETGGRILRINIKDGQQLSKGQLIATLDLEAIQKQIAEMETSLSFLTDVYQRQQRLWDQNIGSEIQVLKAKNDMERVQKSLEAARFQLTKANVYAPISGIVEKVFLKSGEMSAPGSPIAQILNLRKVKVVASLPENYLGILKRGTPVKIKFPALDIERTARVSLIGSSINPANRTFDVEVELNNTSGQLKPNLLALMQIRDFAQKDAVVIPLIAVQQELGTKSFVFIKTENTQGEAVAKKVYVQTGESYQGNIIITNGLKGGEELIMEGARQLHDGDLISITSSQQAPTQNPNPKH